MKKKTKEKQKRRLTDFRPVCIKLDGDARRALGELKKRPGFAGVSSLVRALILEATAPIVQACAPAKKRKKAPAAPAPA